MLSPTLLDSEARVTIGDGQQPIGRGIGPALEAHDVLAVLQGAKDAPQDLRARALTLAGALIELAGAAPEGRGETLAAQALDDGRAWAKFQRICEAQGGMRKSAELKQHRRPLICRARQAGSKRSTTAELQSSPKLAGAPDDKAAGVELHVKLGEQVIAGQPLCTVHAEAPGELTYALDYAAKNESMFDVRG